MNEKQKFIDTLDLLQRFIDSTKERQEALKQAYCINHAEHKIGKLVTITEKHRTFQAYIASYDVAPNGKIRYKYKDGNGYDVYTYKGQINK